MRNGRIHLAQAAGRAQARRLAVRAKLGHLALMTNMPPRPLPQSRPWWRDLAIAAAPVIVVSLLGSAVTVPQVASWYPTLIKPPFNPPNWVFGPVWTTLFVLMAYGVFRILRLPAGMPGRRGALLAYHVQLVFNLAWSCVFFGLNSPLGGLFVIVPLLALILTMLARFNALDRLAGAIQWPYVAWVSFALLLNASIWWLNR